MGIRHCQCRVSDDKDRLLGHWQRALAFVLRAELKAIEEALRRAVAPVVIYTDSSDAVDAFRKGRAFACSSKADGADIWFRIWGILRDFGDFDLRKVKAHTTAQDVAEGLISPTHQAGNAAADYFAVSARKSAEQQSPIRTYDLHYARARAWYRVVLTSIAGWKADLLGDVEDEEVERGITESIPDPPCSLATRKHTIWALNDQWVCRACGQHFSGVLNPRLLAKKVCKGAMYARMLDSLGVLQDPSAFFCHTVREMEAAGAKPWFCDAEARILPDAVAPLSDQASSGLPPVRRLRGIIGKQPDPSCSSPFKLSFLSARARVGAFAGEGGALHFLRPLWTMGHRPYEPRLAKEVFWHS